MRWSVYKVERRPTGLRAIGLGYVYAPHAPAALARASGRWPDKIDPSQRQAGIVIRPYKTDDMPLGPKEPI